MAAAPCGCEAARRADEVTDRTEREMLLDNAPRWRAAWRCPSAGYSEPNESTPLSPECEEALADVRALTGATCGRTCPVWFTTQPWVVRAANLRRWRDKGQLQMRVRSLPAALAQALDAIDEGELRRTDHDLRAARQERAQREAEMNALLKNKANG